MRFNLLGPVSVSIGQDEVVVPPGFPRTMLTALLIDANRVVPAETLADVLWGGRPPAALGAGLRNHLARLRRQLGPEAGARLVTVPPGYLVRIEPGELDEEVFLDGCRLGREQLNAGRFAAAAVTLGEALRLWRGDPLSGVSLGARADAHVQRLHEARLAAWQARIAADLHLGRHDDVVPELRTLAHSHPLREALHEQLMLALYRSGRQAEALDVFRALRDRLIEDLGVEPSPPLQAIHSRILRADPELDRRPGQGAVPETPGSVVGDGGGQSGPRAVCQLPADTRTFIGRAEELDLLSGWVDANVRGEGTGTATVCAIDGMGGSGKSALAIHAAHRLKPLYDDHQLFLDLHGFTAGLEPLDPGDALEWLLRSLGVSPQLIPADVDQRAALYRDQLADSKTLIILDNAVSAAQIRPLLPGDSDTVVLITSRNRLTGLDDARSISLDCLTTREAGELLRQVAGVDRVSLTDLALGELAALCGNLPLALRIAASRLRHHRALQLNELVGKLRDESTRLEKLQDDGRNIRAVFDSSYTSLPDVEQLVFRLVGLAPGPDVDAYAIAAMTGLTMAAAERALESLLDRNLLIQHVYGRFQLHDLTRVYARALGEREPAEERDGALAGLLDYHLYTARRCDQHVARQTKPGPLSAIPTPAEAPPVPNRSHALAWLRVERDCLVASFSYARTQHQHAYVVTLASALATFMDNDCLWRQAADLHQAAITAARRLADPIDVAGALLNLSRERESTGNSAEAAALREESLGIYQSLGNRVGQAHAVHQQGIAQTVKGSMEAAVELHEQALSLYREVGDRVGEATALLKIGRIRSRMSVPAAAVLMQDALDIFHETNERVGEADAQWELARIQQWTGESDRAIALMTTALAIYQEVGNRLGEANALCELGRMRHEQGDHAGALGPLERSLAIYQEIASPHGEAIAARLLGCVRLEDGTAGLATGLLEQALATFRRLGIRIGEGDCLHDLARAKLQAKDPGAAELLRDALRLFEEIDESVGQAEVLISTGALVLETSGPRAAVDYYNRAEALAASTDAAKPQADALSGIAACEALYGELPEARAHLEQALSIYERIGTSDADAAAARLAALETEPTASLR
jgi:DNA-binding SARP family transcriptional activator